MLLQPSPVAVCRGRCCEDLVRSGGWLQRYHVRGRFTQREAGIGLDPKTHGVINQVFCPSMNTNSQTGFRDGLKSLHRDLLSLVRS